MEQPLAKAAEDKSDLPAAASGLARPARRINLLFLAATALTLGIVVVMYFLNVPLGERNMMEYRYSHGIVLRATNWWTLIFLLPLLLGAVYGLAHDNPLVRAVSVPAAMIGLFALILSVVYNTPRPLLQMHMNFRSPSQDGAFVTEAEQIASPAEYLRHFDALLQRTPEQMRGTRILSNTPGMTLLTWWILDTFPPEFDPPGPLERYLIVDEQMIPRDVTEAADAIKVGLAMLAFWVVAAICAYALGRQFFTPPGAFVFALLVSFNPATANFGPGKDVTQLATICLMLWAWFHAVHPRRELPAALFAAALAGALFVVGMTLGLVHAWVALIAWLTTVVWQISARTGVKRLMLLTLAGAAGAAILCLVIYATLGWNVPGTILAVARRYGQIQKSIRFNRAHWFLVGLPLYFLFLPVGLLVAAGLRRRLIRPRDRGWQMLVITAGIMLFTYLVGVTYELPRLWIAFLPLLALGALLDLPLMHARHPRRARALACSLVGVTVLVTVLHWSWLDVRESEYRLFTSRRYFSELEPAKVDPAHPSAGQFPIPPAFCLFASDG